MEWLDLLMRWIHMVSVALVIGSTALLALVLAPALKGVSAESRRPLAEGLKRRLKMLVHSGVAGILLSGLYNTHVVWKTSLPPYPVIYGVKVLLALGVLTVALFAFSDRSGGGAPSYLPSRWLRLGLVIGLVVIALSAYLRTLHS